MKRSSETRRSVARAGTLAVFAFLALAACGSTRAPTPRPSEDDPRVRPATPASQPNRDAPVEDPIVAQRVRDALACDDGWRDPMRGTERCAVVLHAFMTTTFEGNDDVWVRLVESDDVRAVALGAYGLAKATAWRADRSLAARMLDALARTHDAPASEALASAAGLIDGTRTGLTPRLRDAYATLPTDEARAELLESAQRENRDAFFSLTVDVARRADRPGLRLAALEALWSGTPSGKESEVCALWGERSADDDDLVASRAAALVGKRTSPGPCAGELAALVQLLENKAGGALASPRWATTLLDVSDNPAFDSAQRKRLSAIAVHLAREGHHGGTARAHALRAAHNLDRAGGTALARRLAADADPEVAAAANAILSEVAPSPRPR